MNHLGAPITQSSSAQPPQQNKIFLTIYKSGIIRHLCEFSAGSTFRFSFYPPPLFFFWGVGADIYPRSEPHYGVALGALNQTHAVKAAVE